MLFKYLFIYKLRRAIIALLLLKCSLLKYKSYNKKFKQLDIFKKYL